MMLVVVDPQNMRERKGHIRADSVTRKNLVLLIVESLSASDLTSET